MQKVKLGSSDLQVTEVCLGTMTWGVQNTQDEAFEQIDYALEQGINFIDTAELYAVPPSKDTYGVTETYIGNWLAQNPAKRDDIVLASKIAGSGVPWIRDGGLITGEAITKSIDDSLTRLQTEVIDLYQLHWPNRVTAHFSKHWPGMTSSQTSDAQAHREGFLDILTSLEAAIKAGKIRHIGLSNDSPWGISEYVNLAAQHGLPRIASVQNEFSLVHLKDTPYLVESCVLNDVAYLPWSPMAGGALSGKYANGAKPEGCRWTMVQRNGIFRDTGQTHQAIAEYQAVADRHQMSLAQMSLAWVYQFKGVTSSIIGATSMAHLKENIDAYQLNLSEEVLKEIDTVIRKYPLPF